MNGDRRLLRVLLILLFFIVLLGVAGAGTLLDRGMRPPHLSRFLRGGLGCGLLDALCQVDKR